MCLLEAPCQQSLESLCQQDQDTVQEHSYQLHHAPLSRIIHLLAPKTNSHIGATYHCIPISKFDLLNWNITQLWENCSCKLFGKPFLEIRGLEEEEKPTELEWYLKYGERGPGLLKWTSAAAGYHLPCREAEVSSILM